MDGVYNFSSGPSSLPKEVEEKLREGFLEYSLTGLSLFELNRHTKEYAEIIEKTEALLRELLNIPQNYKVLFMNGSSDFQYSAVPLNLLSEHNLADYIISGQLSKNASLEAKKYGDIAIAASSAGASPAFSTIPETKQSDFRPDADYVHICFNNTVYGTKFHYIPDTGNIPLVAEMSSFLLSEPIDVSKFALIYANTECGIGIHGVTIVIIRADLVANARKETPLNLNYKHIAETPYRDSNLPILPIYVTKLVLEWIKSIGGLVEMKRRNERKASLIYDYLDGQSYFTAPVDKKCRSMMNVVFVTGEPRLDEVFIKEAREVGIYNIKGHGSVGGMCVSIYNSMDSEGVIHLIEFMKKFAMEHPKMDA